MGRAIEWRDCGCTKDYILAVTVDLESLKQMHIVNLAARLTFKLRVTPCSPPHGGLPVAF